MIFRTIKAVESAHKLGVKHIGVFVEVQLVGHILVVIASIMLRDFMTILEVNFIAKFFFAGIAILLVMRRLKFGIKKRFETGIILFSILISKVFPVTDLSSRYQCYRPILFCVVCRCFLIFFFLFYEYESSLSSNQQLTQDETKASLDYDFIIFSASFAVLELQQSLKPADLV